MAAGPAMDAGGGPAGMSAATASGSYGLVRTVVAYSTTHLFFWLLTVALVAAIHIASSGSKPSRSDEKEREEREKARRAAAAAAEEREREASARGDDRVLEMMRSFSFMQATEEDFMQGMTEYEYSRVDDGGAHEFAAPEPFAPAPAPASSLSFSFQHQIPEIPRKTGVVLRELTAEEEDDEQGREEEKLPQAALEPLVPLQSAGGQQHQDEEAEEAEFVVVEKAEEQRGEITEEAAATKVVATTHNYQFLTERDFRGFVREPEAMTVRVQESFVPPSSPPPAQFLAERDFRDFVREPEAVTVRVQESFVPPSSPPAAQFLAERDFQDFVREPEAMTVRVQESSMPPSSPPPAQFLAERDFRDFVREPEAMTVRVQESLTPPSSPPPAQFLAERDFRDFVREPEAMKVRVQESLALPSSPPPAQPEERRVVDVSPRSGRFLKERDFRPANEPDDVCLKPKPKPASSPSVASKGSAVGARMSIASEFSGFGDSDSESSASDGYSVKELVVDSDSDWFLSEKDFPASARHSGNLKAYKAKVLKAIQSLEAAAKLEQSYEDSATTVSPGSVGQGSPDILPDGSPKFLDDMWSRSPSPDVEYKEDEEKVTREAEAQYDDEDVERISMAEEEGSDDEQSSIGGKKLALAPVYDAAPVADNSRDHLEEETITLNDHSGEAVSDAQRSPEAVSSRELAAVSSDQIAGPDAKRSPEPSEKEFVGTVDHLLEHSSDSRRETASESDQSYEIVFDDRRRPDPLDTGFVGANDESHELISDVWKEIVSRNDQPHAMARADEEGPDRAEDEYAGGRNDPSNGLVSYEKKVSFSSTNDQSYAAVSGEKSIPETPGQEFSATDQRNGVFPVAEDISGSFREDEEQDSDHLESAARQAYISVTGKAKIYDENGDEDPEAKWKDLTDEEEDELESLWEHQDLIEQLKLELKKVRSIGLPTILEESETPKAPMEDLKPWRIDAKFLREDPMDELNKFYKSYRERMRKFDILCYQKMYAIDFLQLRGPQQSTSSLKSLSPTVTSILSHNFRSSRRRSPEDPSERFLKELRYDLETVYVGQMCLSWEFLRWQYEQARDLPESDPYHSHQYNQVAGEFQQFQVVVQRFVEDESFKGPRLPNYINNRCVLRNLLQVPVIKEDSLKDRMEDQRKGNYVITSEELEDIMEDAMHILWEFIKADKADMTTTSVLKGFSSAHVELQDPSDHDLMAHIHATLQKKEKRLKDLLRTGNCIVKKFKKPKEDRSNQNLFFSQVDMKLVARVLRMPRITSEQLQWCKAKLDKITLVDRKIHREASFLLFPC